MAFFEWNQSVSVGVPSLDKEHQKLVAMVNQLYEAMKSGKGAEVLGNILDELVNYTQTHFAHEEALLKTHGYPGLAKHQDEHKILTQSVLDLVKKLQAGQLALTNQAANLLKGWLVNHIQGTDKKYGPFLAERGVR